MNRETQNKAQAQRGRNPEEVSMSSSQHLASFPLFYDTTIHLAPATTSAPAVTVWAQAIVHGRRQDAPGAEPYNYSGRLDLILIGVAFYADDKAARDLWALADGFGRGFDPVAHGWDWSHLRDSSEEAIAAMFERALAEPAVAVALDRLWDRARVNDVATCAACEWRRELEAEVAR